MQQGDWKFARCYLDPIVKQGQQLPCPPEQVRALPVWDVTPKPQPCFQCVVQDFYRNTLLTTQVQDLHSMSNRSLQPYIRNYGNWTSATITSGTISAKLCLMSYCDEVVRVCCCAIVDHIHICTALTGLSEACQASVSCYGDDASEDSDLQQMVQSLATTLCSKLMGFTQCLQARDCAVALHALASLQIQPDSCQPGLSDVLASAIMQDTACHNASKLVKALQACSRLGLNPCEGQLVSHLVKRLASWHSVQPRLLCNAFFALRVQPFDAIPVLVIDSLCNQLQRQLRLSSSSYHYVTPNVLDSCLVSLYILRHLPDSGFTDAFVAWSFQLMTEQKQQPNPAYVHRWASVMLACAHLGIKIPHEFASRVVEHVLYMLRQKNEQPSHGVTDKTCAQLAWALAVMDVLDIAQMQTLVLAAQHGQGVNDAGDYQWHPTTVAYLHQALDHLQPASRDLFQASQRGLLSKSLHQLAPRAMLNIKVKNSRVEQLLQEVGLTLNETVRFGLFQAYVMLSQDNDNPAIIVAIVGPRCYMRHPPNM